MKQKIHGICKPLAQGQIVPEMLEAIFVLSVLEFGPETQKPACHCLPSAGIVGDNKLHIFTYLNKLV